MNYRVHILMATYNGESYLKEQIDSLIAQTYKNWCLTIYDDGSSDNTANIVAEYQAQHGEEKIRFYENHPASGGAKQNFMKLIRENTGEYLMCCDQDDVWHPDKIEKSLKRMRRMEVRYGKDVPLLVYTELRVVDEKLSVIAPAFHPYMNLRTGNQLSYELIQNQVTGCTTMFNKTMQTYMARVKDSEQILMHDHVLALVALCFGAISFIKEPLIDYRQHGDNSVGAKDAKSPAYLMMRFKLGRQKFRDDLMASCGQAAYLLTVFDEEFAGCIESEKVILLIRYSALYTVKKSTRIKDFYRFRFLKKGWLLKIVQTLWC